jgi:hypothetical protein
MERTSLMCIHPMRSLSLSNKIFNINCFLIFYQVISYVSLFKWFQAEILAKYKPILNATLLIPNLKQVEETTAKALEYFKSTRHIILYYEDVVKNRTVSSANWTQSRFSLTVCDMCTVCLQNQVRYLPSALPPQYKNIKIKNKMKRVEVTL